MTRLFISPQNSLFSKDPRFIKGTDAIFIPEYTKRHVFKTKNVNFGIKLEKSARKPKFLKIGPI